MRIDTPLLAKQIRIEVGNTVGAGAVARGFRLGLYSCLRTGNPGRKLYESADLAATVAYANKLLTFNGTTGIRLLPGWYYVALCHDYATTAPNWYGSSYVANVGYNDTPLGKNTSAGVDSTPACSETLAASWTTLPALAAATPTAIYSSPGAFCPLIELV